MKKKKYLGKSQWVRLVDIFLLGPFMIYMGYVIFTLRILEETPNHLFYASIILIISGVLTILYNGKNYLEIIK